MLGFDMNRNYATRNFTVLNNPRNYTGKKPFTAVESKSLSNFMLTVKESNKKSKIVVLDVHGWLDETIGDTHISKHYNKEFGNKNRTNALGSGYLITWAKEKLSADVSLIEFPWPKDSADIRRNDFSGKFTKATYNMLRSI